jgi:cyclohexa-1,5-dienecarbonyl-CoA hydratase
LTPTANQYERIHLQLAPPLAHISLACPPVNVIDLRMMDELSQAFTQIEALPPISMIVISGGGKGFSTGVDVAAHTPDQIDVMLQKFHAVIRAVLST